MGAGEATNELDRDIGTITLWLSKKCSSSSRSFMSASVPALRCDGDCSIAFNKVEVALNTGAALPRRPPFFLAAGASLTEGAAEVAAVGSVIVVVVVAAAADEEGVVTV